MPEISVIIPTYNRSSLAREAVESVLAQTFADFEVLVIDDGSTDNTKQVIESIQDNRIKYSYKDNGGVSSARNMGIGNASGAFIAFLDSDDLRRLSLPGTEGGVGLSKMLIKNSSLDIDIFFD